MTNGRIAYGRSGRAGRVDIVTVRPDGSGSRRLTFGGNSSLPHWSPGGGRIAFRHDRWRTPTRGRFELGIMDADGTNKRILAIVKANHDRDIAWSPDGRYIAYTSGTGISVVAVRTGTATVLVDAGVDAIAGGPVWSPDGSRIAYGYGWEDVNEVFTGQVRVYEIETGESTAVAPRPGGRLDAGQPCWSPNGLKLAYSSYWYSEEGQEPYDFDIAVVGSGGVGDHLLSHRATDEEHPKWRPQGGRILFTKGYAGSFPFSARADGLVTIRPDGTDRRVISSSGESWAEWSPNGKRILALRPLSNGDETNKRPGVWVLRPNGNKKRRVIAIDWVVGVDWQPRPVRGRS